MACTEMQSRDASLIAYLTILSPKNRERPENSPPLSVKDLILQNINIEEAEKKAGVKYDGSYEKFMEILEVSNIDEGNKNTIKGIRKEALEWKYLADRDTNSSTGFFGCALETGEGEAIVAFRGSQAFGNYENTVDDWGRGDIELIRGLTVQDTQAEIFADELAAKGILNGYSIDVAGHSLGGELATHFTIYCVENQPEMYNRINHCYNLDGPGRDKSYRERYASSIAIAKDKITNYGVYVEGILEPIGDVVPIDVKSAEEATAGKEGIPKLIQMVLHEFQTHSLLNWKVDPNDSESFKRSDSTSGLYQGLHVITNAIDDSPLEEPLFTIYKWVVDTLIEKGPDGNIKLTPYGEKFIAATAVALGTLIITEGIIGTIVTVVSAIAIVTIAVTIADGLKWAIDNIEEVCNVIVNEFKTKLGELKGTLDKIKTDIITNWNSFKNNLKNIINPAYNYASNNPYIKVNTSELRDYAYRIKQINETIKGLDYRLDLLYYNAGLLDVWNLMQTDIILGYSYRLANCESYLNETADAFERAEANIMNL